MVNGEKYGVGFLHYQSVQLAGKKTNNFSSTCGVIISRGLKYLAGWDHVVESRDDVVQ